MEKVKSENDDNQGNIPTSKNVVSSISESKFTQSQLISIKNQVNEIIKNTQINKQLQIKQEDRSVVKKIMSVNYATDEESCLNSDNSKFASNFSKQINLKFIGSENKEKINNQACLCLGPQLSQSKELNAIESKI